jgi:hypothetical protein
VKKGRLDEMGDMILDGQCNRCIQDGIENIHVHIDVESLLLSVFQSSSMSPVKFSVPIKLYLFPYNIYSSILLLTPLAATLFFFLIYKRTTYSDD